MTITVLKGKYSFPRIENPTHGPMASTALTLLEPTLTKRSKLIGEKRKLSAQESAVVMRSLGLAACRRS